MAMAEVAATPSQTSAAGTAVPAVAGSSSRSKSPLLFASSSPSTTPRAIAQHHQHTQHQIRTDQAQPVQPQYNPTNSPGDGSSTNFFSHHQRLSPQSSMHLSSTERNIPRGLPPIVSSMPGASPPGPSQNDPRQPVSPRTVSLGLSDSSQGLEGVTGDTAPRKRSKVSRACDECRRKKIRCDATSESGVEQCSSCKRVGSKCSFSRVPMKRGPSKGYIKELADRLNTLENSMSTGDMHSSYGSGMAGEGDQSPGPSDSTSPPPAGPSSSQKQSRKRALSTSSDFQPSVHLQPLSQPNPTSRSNERLPSIDSFHPTTQHQHQQRAQLLHESQPQRQLPHLQQAPPTHAHQPPPPPPPPHHASHQHPPSTAETSAPGYRATLSPNGMGQYWKSVSEVGGRRASVSFPFESPDLGRSAAGSTPGDISGFEWDDEIIDQ
ncbi:hypothetical protein L873DRAFT_1693752 [Choiromyces venosus 120613-1]|uniref:Zn(2)-C6 fungal-type domain-containing protein n=1 Tax=Choiromyces venosus 120613-1 TaxID=1336337 RepID=A0A3N4JEL1_9PEZI|nr:hypothetical protein L873DRAFT_1693752 [Choiromyces venosus 120613-1]